MHGLGRGRAAWRGLGPRAGPGDPPSCPRAERRPRLPPCQATRGPFRPRTLTWRGLAPGREKEGEAFAERARCGRGGVVRTFVGGGALTFPVVSRAASRRFLEGGFLRLFEGFLRAPLPWKSFKVTFPNEWCVNREKEAGFFQGNLDLEK